VTDSIPSTLAKLNEALARAQFLTQRIEEGIEDSEAKQSDLRYADVTALALIEELYAAYEDQVDLFIDDNPEVDTFWARVENLATAYRKAGNK
jgi:hypothetical protein